MRDLLPSEARDLSTQTVSQSKKPINPAMSLRAIAKQSPLIREIATSPVAPRDDLVIQSDSQNSSPFFPAATSQKIFLILSLHGIEGLTTID